MSHQGGGLLGGPGQDSAVQKQLCLDRIDICTATLGVVSRQTEYDAAVTRPRLEACVATCKSCGDECERRSRQRAFGR